MIKGRPANAIVIYRQPSGAAPELAGCSRETLFGWNFYSRTSKKALVIMSEQQRQEPRQAEISFRQGACQGAQWLQGQAERMATDGASADQATCPSRARFIDVQPNLFVVG
jgi:hypothetical protein